MRWSREIVPNIVLCKKLKKAGYPQRRMGLFWIRGEDGKWKLEELYAMDKITRFYEENPKGIVKAPTPAEMVEELPPSIQKGRKLGTLVIWQVRKWGWCVAYTTKRTRVVLARDKKLANALAKMYIEVEKEGLV